MSKYSYSELKKAAQTRRRIGGYDGMDVYAISKFVYDPPVHSKGYYVLYDDGNKLVKGLTVYGTIDENGLLDLWKIKGEWHSPLINQFKSNDESVTRQVPATAYSAVVAQAEGNTLGEAISSDSWFTKLDREINELLSSAKTTEYDVFVAGYEMAVK
jgi:hypothetical protein